MIKVYNVLAIALVLLSCGLFITTSFGHSLGSWPNTIKWIGLALQISGMLLVFRGLDSKRDAFDVPSILTVTKDRLRKIWNLLLRHVLQCHG